MPDRYNKAYWKHLDKMIADTEVVIDRASGTSHPEYENMIYPYDYGYLAGTSSADGGGMDVFMGKSGEKKAVGIVCTVDLVKRDSEVKILLGCTHDEMREIIEFLNDGEGMQALLVKRED